MKKTDFSIRNLIYLFHAFILIGIITLGWEYKAVLVYEDFEAIISILQNTAAMIFTIMGLWVAYLYPNAIMRITQPSRVEAIFPKDDERRIKLLVGTIIISSIVMALLVVLVAIKPVLAKSQLYSDFPNHIRCAGIIILFSMCYIQIVSIYIVVASNVNFIVDIKNKRNIEDINKLL